MEAEIKDEFKKNGFTLDDEEDILKKCLTFCIQYKLSPSDLVSSWDVFSLNRGLELTVQSALMGAFLQQLQNEQRDALVKKEPGLHFYSSDIAMKIGDEDEDKKDAVLHTPTNRSEKHSKPFDSPQQLNGSSIGTQKVLDSVTPFGQRKARFEVQFTLNNPVNVGVIKKENEEEPSEDDIIKRVPTGKHCPLHIETSQPDLGCRFMYDRIEAKFSFLENRIRKLATTLAASGFEEPTDPTVASQRAIFAVGMICCEEEGRLKEKPVLLQTSVEHSGGQRVRLDLQKLDQFSIFPGQMVGVEGHNPSGHCLIASKIIDRAPLSLSSNEDSHPAKRHAMDQNLLLTESSHAMSELSMIIAAGPFTTSDNLLFEPLNELLAYARRQQPQILLLIGPFVDSEHPEIKKGTVNMTFDDIFSLLVLQKLQDYVEYMGSTAKVVLVPSIRDANHDFVFPQPAFDTRSISAKKQIYSVTNPGRFSADEIHVACCSVDILKHLSAEEISRNPKGGFKQRLTNLSNHLLNQHSFYPLYPPAEAIPLDFSLAPEALEMPSIPDILVLPSDLAHFVRVLSLDETSEGEEQRKCLCINPGRLARGEGGGFFVEIQYRGSPDSTSASIIRL